MKMKLIPPTHDVVMTAKRDPIKGRLTLMLGSVLTAVTVFRRTSLGWCLLSLISRVQQQVKVSLIILLCILFLNPRGLDTEKLNCSKSQKLRGSNLTIVLNELKRHFVALRKHELRYSLLLGAFKIFLLVLDFCFIVRLLPVDFWILCL